MLSSPYSQRLLLHPVSLASQFLLVSAILLGSTAPLEMLMELTSANDKLHTLAWLLLYLLAFCGLFLAYGINWITWLIRYRLLLVILLCGAVLTIPWSVDPMLSFNRLVHLLGTSIIGIYLGFTIPPTLMLRAYAVILGILMALCIIFVQLMPEFALEPHNNTLVWKGVLDNKNTLGFWAGTGLILYPWLFLQSQNKTTRLLSVVALLMCLVVLVQSRSAGSMIAMTIAISVIVYLSVSRKLKFGFAAMAVLAVLLTILASLIITNIDIAAAAGRSTDLTGRAEIWKQTWKLIEQRPLTGYGYGTIWTPTDETIWIQKKYTDFTWKVYHAHNGLLQVASEIGIPLAAVALLFVIQQLVEIIHCQYRKNQAGAIFTVGFMIAYLISNYSEARFMLSRELFWLFFIALPIGLIRQVQPEDEESVQTRVTAIEPDARRLRYPDEIIPNPNSKLRDLQEAKNTRRLRRESFRLTSPDNDD